MRALAPLFLAAVALASCQPSIEATPKNLAWDEVTRLVDNADINSLQPGSFSHDFAMATVPQATSVPRGALQPAGPANRDAVRHYVAGSKERIDDITDGSATIIDCAARTITTLDLTKKTYSVSSAPPGTDVPVRGYRVAGTLRNAMKGSRWVEGVRTTEYRSNFTWKATPRGVSEINEIVTFFAGFNRPLCAGLAYGETQRLPRIVADNLKGTERLFDNLRTGGNDYRISVTQSGPKLPFGRFAMYQAVLYVEGSASSAAMITERGNLRAISADDPVFRIPSGFKKKI